MAEQNFTYESVFRYLRAGLSGLTIDEVDEFIIDKDNKIRFTSIINDMF